MKIDKLSDLFEINFKKPSVNELLELFKLCLKYHSRLFDDDFYHANFSTPERFLKLFRFFIYGISCAQLVRCFNFGGFFYLYSW